MFSAMAGGDYYSSGSFGATDLATAKNAPAVAADSDSFWSFPPAPAETTSTIRTTTTTSPQPTTSFGGENSTQPTQSKDTGSFVGLASFSQAASGISDNSGTFNMVSTTSNDSSARSAARNFNLEAAAAALADPSDHHGSPPQSGLMSPLLGMGGMSLPLLRGGNVGTTGRGGGVHERSGDNPTVPPLVTNGTPMHVQQVFIPRPLFFGSILPPRVLDEARTIVKNALLAEEENATNQRRGRVVAAAGKDAWLERPSNHHHFPRKSPDERQQQQTRKKPIKISRLKPEVRNLISCLHTYGHGISILPEDENVGRGGTRKENKSEYWRGTSYLSVYCPAWGDIEASSTNTTTTTTTGPDKISEATSDDAARSNSTIATVLSNTTTGAAASTPRSVSVSQRKYLKKPTSSSLGNPQAASAGGTEPAAVTRPVVNVASTQQEEAATKKSSEPSESHSSSLAADKPPRTVDTSKNGVVSERDLFSMWARGETAGENEVDSPSRVGPSSSSLDNDSSSSLPMDKVTANDSSSSLHLEEPTVPRAPASSTPLAPSTPTVMPVRMSDQDLFSQWARGESPGHDSSFARRDGMQRENSFVVGRSRLDSIGSVKVVARETISMRQKGFFNSDTFMPVEMMAEAGDSDDDSVVGSELKKKVGVNEHLNAALASLEEDFLPSNYDTIGGGGPNLSADDSGEARVTQVPLTADGGRPLNNLELMNGCTPLFGVDDSPLPVEADLGIHETKDEQVRSNEQRRNQAIIENYCPQNVFGPVACPNPAVGPDDNHSWYSRSTPQLLEGQLLHGSARTPSGGMGSLNSTADGPSLGSGRNLSGLPSLPDIPPPPPKRSDKSPLVGESRRTSSSAPLPPVPKGRKWVAPKSGSGPPPNGLNQPGSGTRTGRFDSKTRYGWWNVPEEPASVSSDKSETAATGNTRQPSNGSIAILDIEPETRLQLPPAEHSATAVAITTNLEPTREKLQEQNRPLSHLHPATSLAQALPFLADRPPSYRYLQVDTQAVGFPTLGGEVEPFFCSLAIYNVETVAQAAIAGDETVAPIPNLQRCGRVTETLHFDVVSDPVVELLCRGSLWPFLETPPKGLKGNALSRSLSPNDSQAMVPESERTQGTRCGVFPLASNLNIANLYAVLIVHKVVSETTDFEAYLRPNKATGTDKNSLRPDKVDIEALRLRAEKAANRQGRFIMPLAFGVAPLLQVFAGAENPVVPSSRAVQIPLFRFTSGLGDRQVIDHIMVMLFPRYDRRIYLLSQSCRILGSYNFDVLFSCHQGRPPWIERRGAEYQWRNCDVSDEKLWLFGASLCSAQ
jgi:hypothetical protein